MRKCLLSVSLVALSLSAFARFDCFTNATVAVLTGSGVYTGHMKTQADLTSLCCQPLDSSSWAGSCIVGYNPNCLDYITNGWSGVPLNVTATGSTNVDVIVGMIWGACSNGGFAQAPIIMPANCVDCTFHFIGGCGFGTNCAVVVCPDCNMHSTPAPPPE